MHRKRRVLRVTLPAFERFLSSVNSYVHKQLTRAYELVPAFVTAVTFLGATMISVLDQFSLHVLNVATSITLEMTIVFG